jgi:hypothetical protein
MRYPIVEGLCDSHPWMQKSPTMRDAHSLRTGCSSARRRAAGYCFVRVRERERVRVNGGAAPTVLQGRPRGHEANSCLRPARVFVPNPPGNPESADGRLARLSRSRLLALGGLDALARGGLQDLLIE